MLQVNYKKCYFFAGKWQYFLLNFANANPLHSFLCKRGSLSRPYSIKSIDLATSLPALELLAINDLACDLRTLCDLPVRPPPARPRA